jgi:UMF1 family MFS transporter
VTSASLLALLAIIGITSFGVSFVCLNSYLPDLGRGGVEVRAAQRRLEEEAERLATEREQAGGGSSRADERPGLMLPGVEFAAGQQGGDDEREGAPLLEDEVLTGQMHDERLAALQQALAAARSTYTATVSLFGIAIGYGGGTLLYIPAFFLVSALKGSTFSLRLVVGLSGAMWLVATTPALLWLGSAKPAGSRTAQLGWRHEVARSWRNLGRMVRPREVRRLANLFYFLLAWFFLSDGPQNDSSPSRCAALSLTGEPSPSPLQPAQPLRARPSSLPRRSWA